MVQVRATDKGEREMSKWIERWVKRWEDKFPECAIRCSFREDCFGYVVEAYYPKHQAWQETGDWHIWGIILNSSASPAVRQNRLSFRKYSDRTLREQIDRFREKEGEKQ